MPAKNLKSKKIPKNLQGILWSVDIKDLDIEKDKWYIIHQFLIYGDFKELAWLFKTYGKKEILKVFLNTPSKNYPAIIFHFVKNYLLGLKNKTLDEGAYVTSIHGPVKPRAATGL